MTPEGLSICDDKILEKNISVKDAPQKTQDTSQVLGENDSQETAFDTVICPRRVNITKPNFYLSKFLRNETIIVDSSTLPQNEQDYLPEELRVVYETLNCSAQAPSEPTQAQAPIYQTITSGGTSYITYTSSSSSPSSSVTTPSSITNNYYATLPTCPTGQVLVSNGSGGWNCQAAGSIYNFNSVADSGPNTNYSSGSFLTLAGGDGVETVSNGTGTITFNIAPCNATEILEYNGTDWVCTSAAGVYSFDLVADSGANATINNANVVTMIGGDGLATVADGAGGVTYDVNPGTAIDTTGDTVNVLYAGPITVNGSNQLTLQSCALDETLVWDGSNWVCAANNMAVQNGLSVQGGIIELGNPNGEVAQTGRLIHNTDIPSGATGGTLYTLSFDGENQGVGTGPGSTGNFGIGTLTPEDQLELTRNLLLAHTVSDATGVINKKGNTRFIHDFGTDNDFFGVGAGNFTLTGTGLVGVGHDSLTAVTSGSNIVGVGLNAGAAITSANRIVAIGSGAFAAAQTVDDTVAVGYNALNLSTGSLQQVAVGSQALEQDLDGWWNVGVGFQALQDNQHSNANVAIGWRSMADYVEAGGLGYNVGIGYEALKSTSGTGSFNNAVGYRSLYSLTSGFYNNAFGTSALRQNTTGSNNSAFGESALRSNLAGISNTAMGYQSLYSNLADNNTAVGASALRSNTTGIQNSALGANALQNNVDGNFNTALGVNAMQLNTAGSYNNALGVMALINNLTGNYNNAIGFQSLLSNNSGSLNNAVGMYALLSNTSGSSNNAVGYQALYSNTTASNNNAFGTSALQTNSTGGNNNAFGTNALFANSNGNQNNAFGGSALQSNTTGGNNNAFGQNALVFNTIGSGNNAHGTGALQNNNSGNNNDAFGGNALFFNSTGSFNEAIGTQAMMNTSSGNFNIAIGFNALLNNTTGSTNVAVGASALQGSVATTFSNLTAVGANAGQSNSTGANNVFVGQAAGSTNNTGSANIFVGQGSGTGNTSGGNNTIIGQNAATNNQTGSNNTLVGQSAGNGSGSNSYNRLTAVGSAAFLSNTTGGFNVGFGVQAGASNNTGSENTAIGDASLFANTTGGQNTVLGRGAGNANTTGSRNTYLGYFAGLSSTNNLTNASAVGYNAQVTCSSCMVLGGTGADGINVGIGLTAPIANFHNNGSTVFTQDVFGNFAVGGAIGSAATTVDIRTSFRIAQTTSGQTLSLPNPTNTTRGRIAFVINNGTASFTIHNVVIPPNRGAPFMWDGTQWVFIADGNLAANNGLRVADTADRIQLGVVTTASGATKAQANLLFNTEVPQNNFSISWTGNNTNDMFGIGTLAGSTPDPNRLSPVTTSNLNERLDVVGNIENIADPSFNPTVLTANTGCTNPLTLGGGGGNARAIHVDNRYGYILASSGGSDVIQIYDFERSRCPSYINSLSTNSSAGFNTTLAVSGQIAIVGGNFSALSIVDISNHTPPISAPHILATMTINPALNMTIRKIHIQGNYAYVALDDNTVGNADAIAVVDISNPSRPVSVNYTALAVDANPVGLYAQGRYLYVINSNATIQSFDIQNPVNMTSAAGATALGIVPANILVDGNYAYITGTSGLGRIVSISNPSSFSLLGTITTLGNGSGIAQFGRYLLFSGLGNNNVSMLDVQNPATTTSAGSVGSGGTSTTQLAVAGRSLYTINFTSNNISIIDLHGIETTAILAHAAEIGALQVNTNAFIDHELQVGGSAVVGQALQVQGDTSVSGNIENLSNSKFAPNLLTGAANLNSGAVTMTTPRWMAMQGRYGYIVGNNGASSTMKVVDMTTNNTHTVVATLNLNTGTAPSNGSNPTSIAIQGKYAYIANSSSNNLQIVDISNPASPVVISSISTVAGDAADYKHVWIQDIYAYVVSPPVGSGAGTLEIFDVANASNPRLTSTLTLGVDTSSLFVQGRYAYVTNPDVAPASGSVQIIDIFNPTSPTIVSTYTGFAISAGYPRGIFRPQGIAVQGAMAYVTYDYDAGANSDFLVALNIADPVNPVLYGATNDLGGGFNPSQVTIAGRYAYVMSGAATNLASVHVFDITDPNIIINPFQPANMRRVSGPIASTIANARNTVINGHYLYTYQNTGAVITSRVFDIHGTETTSILAHSAELGSANVMGSASVANQLSVAGGLSVGQNAAFDNDVAIQGQLNVTGRIPRLVSTFSPLSQPQGIATDGRYIYVSQANSAFLRILDANNPTLLSAVDGGGVALDPSCGVGAYSLDVAGKYAYIGCTSGQLQVYDISTPNTATFLGGVATTTTINTLQVEGKYVYISGANGILAIVDVSNPRAPVLASASVSTATTWSDIEVLGKYAYIADQASGLRIYDVSNPYAPVAVSTTAVVGGLLSIQVQDAFVYSSTNLATLVIHNVSNPSTPTLVSTTSISTSSHASKISGKFIYFAGPGGNSDILDISNPSSPQKVNVTSFLTGGNNVEMVLQGRYLYILNFGAGNLRVFDLGGAYLQEVETGNIETSTLTIRSGLQAQEAFLSGGLSVGQNMRLDGNAAVAGNLVVGGGGLSTNIFAGINPSAGNYQMSIMGNTTSATNTDFAVQAITNLTTTDDTNNNVLRLNLGTVNTGTNSRFIRFFAGSTNDNNGTAVGNISLNNNAVAYNTAGADFAERIFLQEGVRAEAGDLIMSSAQGPSIADSTGRVIGVVSDSAGFVGNADMSQDNASDSGTLENKQNSAIVGLLGQISTKVATINGPIKTGDPIAATQLTGIGGKALAKGYIVGFALEDFDPTTNKDKFECPAENSQTSIENSIFCGKIKVLVRPNWFDPMGSEILAGLQIVGSNDNSGLEFIKSLNSVAYSLAGSQRYGFSADTNLAQKAKTSSTISFEDSSIISSKAVNQSTLANLYSFDQDLLNISTVNALKALDNRLQGFETGITFDPEGNARFKASIKAASIEANEIAALTLLTNRIGYLEQHIETVTPSIVPEAGSITPSPVPKVISTTLSSDQPGLEIAGSLKVLGEARFEGESIFAKLVTFVKEVVFKGSVRFLGEVFFSSDHAGTIILPKGQSRYEVKFASAHSGTPVVLLTLKSAQKIDYLRVVNESNQGFEIEISPISDQDIIINWTATWTQNSESLIIDSSDKSNLNYPSLSPVPVQEISPTPIQVTSPEPSSISPTIITEISTILTNLEASPESHTATN